MNFKAIFTLIIAVISFTVTSQNKDKELAQNGPFASIGKKSKVLTLPGHDYVYSAPDTVEYFGWGFSRSKQDFVYVKSEQEIAKDTVRKKLNNESRSRWLSIDPVVHPYESPYAGMSNNPILFLDPDGADIVDANGNKVNITYNKDGTLGFSKNATDDIKRVANALNLTETGKSQLKKVDASDIKVKIKISTETKITEKEVEGGGKSKSYLLGRTVQGNNDKSKNYGKYKDKDGNYGITEASITIYEGTINEATKEGSNNLHSGLTVEQSIGATAAHEIEHATNKSEINKDLKSETEDGKSRTKKETESVPVKVEKKVIAETKSKND